MSRVETVDLRYRAVESIVRDGVSLVVVSDPRGFRLNRAVRAATLAAQEDEGDLWEGVLAAAKSLRWKLVFRPQPLEFNPGLPAASEAVRRQSALVRPALGNEGKRLLDELVNAAETAAAHDPATGSFLLESLLETGTENCVVVTDGSSSRAGVAAWLEPLGFEVVSPGMLAQADRTPDVAYIAGPPRLLRSSLVTAPPAPEVTFYFPAWFGDRSLPNSAIADLSEGAVKPTARIFEVGDLGSGDTPGVPGPPEPLEDFFPIPAWGQRHSTDREPAPDEVTVHKVLLSGGLAIWMDNGDRIRTFDPSQTSGERVTYTDVAAVQRGTYLVLRLGSTERAALYAETIRLMGNRGPIVQRSQERWKKLLLDKLRSTRRAQAQRELVALGVSAVDQAAAWTDPTLARPQRDSDFASLLSWLDIPQQPSFANATDFRRSRSRAAAKIREELEEAMAAADMERLRADGHLRVEGTGFAGIIATRVLAISPFTNIVARHEAREVFNDRGGEWLE